MRIELYILNAQVFDLIITKTPKQNKIGFETKKEKNDNNI